jgi:hypothetical protein
MDEIAPRGKMEASENTAMSREGGSEFALHRVDPDRVSRMLSGRADPGGFARLDLMVNTIFDRLVSGERRRLPGS